MNPFIHVIKIGSHVIDDKPLLSDFLYKVSTLNEPIILIHGGGKKATQLCKDLNIPTEFNQGRRITSEASLEVAVMVYAGLINKSIVAQLQSFQQNSIGLCGVDLNCIPAKKRPITENVDFGWVGDPSQNLDLSNLQYFLENKIIPVFAPITHDSHGQLLNTNADTIAFSIAENLSRLYNVNLCYCFEKKGVLKNVDDNNSVIPKINHLSLDTYIYQKQITDGMIPKLMNAASAIKAGVNNVTIGHAEDIIQLLKGTAGTKIY